MESLTDNESGQPNKRKRENAEELLTVSAKRIKVNTGDFLGEIVTLSKSNDDKERAKKFASSMSDLILETQTERRQIYFTDASFRSSCSAAIGVAWRTSDGHKRWDGEADELDLDYQNNVLAEIYAIEWAMDMAINEIRRTQTQAPKTECVFIFSDCLPALTGIKKAGLESADGWLVEGTEQLDLYQSILDYSLEFQAWGAQL
ncbi:hypothetical protein PENSTE_c008G04946 [Penicillium steckii]|uniref:Uncharacterized protein n=1 Tax=Penicillium steckii TaxID=303698 RepID=A0A1V6TEB3_9EURO|nr:hypothetical protein PENSTE_c008G04946 [Penicillium steckii]